jgi:acetoin utilization deacetylase AcuC-like enzyme
LYRQAERGEFMKKTGFLHDSRYLLHDTGPYHPEVSDRLVAIFKGIEDGGLLPHLKRISATAADLKWVLNVHDRRYIDRFSDMCQAGASQFDSADNQMCRETYDTALLAVGGVIEAARLMMSGEIDNAFCAVRPPGHHAEVDRAMGFCYFNNIAIAARYLQQEWQVERVGIIDYDVHHGNGTQHIFEQDASVYYYSIHEHPTFAFPGTGREFEVGSGAGEGFTKNSPVLPGQGDKEYRYLLERDLMPAFEAFQPEVILVSVGFDAHEDDDMSGIRLSTDAYSWTMEQITGMADTLCGGRLISVLEGGYCLRQLPELARNHVNILLKGSP